MKRPTFDKSMSFDNSPKKSFMPKTGNAKMNIDKLKFLLRGVRFPGEF